MTSECVLALEENPKDVYLEITSILLKLVDNVLNNPSNPKYRSIRLGNPIVSNKLLPAIGAMECLFEMGFKEAEDSLVLPNNIGVERLQSIRDEIMSRRHKYLKTETKTVSRETYQQSLPSTSIPSCSSVIQETKIKGNSFLQQIEENFQHVQIYENKELQAKALDAIPLRELELAAVQNMRKIQKTEKSNQTNIIDDNIGIQDLLLLELLSWFKNSFFKWVDAPECSFCSSNTKFQQTLLQEGIRVEVYVCENCDQKTLFPRYRDPGKLLKTRKGRCGEWASCFTLLCRALGWDARYVVDETDHLWTEIYSGTQKRWLHCDPCENVYDCPLMYEMGWGKKLTYIIAYSREEVQDVTWRYSCKHQEVLGRRRQCTELELLEKIMKLRNKRQSTLSASRQAYLSKRLVTELVEFLTPRSPTDQEMKGRNSGSLAWRLARGEISPPVTAACYVWIPTSEELKAQEMHIKFSTSRNAYIRAIGGEELNGWENGAFEVTSLFRKEEKDWNFIYLCRTEGSDVGRITWKFDLTNCGMVVDAVSLQFLTTVYETGKVSVKLCSEDTCQLIPNGMEKFDTSGFSGSLQLELSAVLNGGSGNVAWQHAQLFRQKSDNMSGYPLDIIIKLRKT